MNTRSIRFRMAAWYAGSIIGFFLLFGSVVYLSLGHYLESTLRANLSDQAQDIAADVRTHVVKNKISGISGGISEHFAPHLTGRFIRVTASDGNIIYVSPPSADGLLDGNLVPKPHPNGRAEEYGIEERMTSGPNVLVQVVPVRVPGGKHIIVEVGALYEPIEQVLHGLMLIFGIGLPLVVIIAVFGAQVLIRRAFQPVKTITRQAERISYRNLFERLPVVNTGDEIERLTLALNRMMARLEAAFQHVNRFSADVSHELRTPLTILRGELEAATRNLSREEFLDVIGSSLEETERLQKIVEQLLALAKLDSGDFQLEFSRIDLGKLVTSTAEQMRLLAEEKSIQLRYEIEPGVRVKGEPSRLTQLIVNLLGNAISYTGEGGDIVLSVAGENQSAIFEVSDNGIGIPADALPHVFERFYRADKARSRDCGGSGLGLSIVKAICTAHRGEVSIESTEGIGTRVSVCLPLDLANVPLPAPEGSRREQVVSVADVQV
jgi:heavy metal sensor kinase